MDKRKRVILVIVITVVVIAIAASYFMLYKKTCEDKACFLDSLVKCNKAVFASADSKTAVEYTILGKNQNNCVTNVKIALVKQGAQELAPLEGKEMTCTTTMGVAEMPEKDLTNCKGELKEKMQEIIINRLYSQIYQNLGEIKGETTIVIGD